MKLSNYFFIILLFAFGCTPKIINPATPSIGQQPAVGVTSSATVGSAMFTQWDYIAQKFAIPSMNIVKKTALGGMNIPAGTQLPYTIKDGKECYCTTYIAWRDFLNAPVTGICFVSLDGKVFTSFIQTGDVGNHMLSLDTPIPYKEMEMMSGNSGFKMEIMYLGKDNNTIKIAYREYTGNTIRPAFTQEVSYTLPALPSTISFRTVRLEVIKADNNEISYKVLSGFN